MNLTLMLWRHEPAGEFPAIIFYRFKSTKAPYSDSAKAKITWVLLQKPFGAKLKEGKNGTNIKCYD